MKNSLARLIGILLIFCILFACGCTPVVEETEKPSKKPSSSSSLERIKGEEGTLVLAAEEGRLSLYVDPVSGIFEVRDSETGKVWESNPAGRVNDPIAGDGILKMNLHSLMLFSLVNMESNVEGTEVNTYTQSVTRGESRCYKLENGFRMEYTMPGRGGAILPLEITLFEGKLKARLPLDDIVEGEKERFSKVSILPYFCAAGIDQEGYLLVPDGSGALIEFNNEKSNLGDYSQPVYGKELSKTALIRDNVTNSIRLPVFGMQGRFFGIIESAAPYASVNAATSGVKNSFNYVYASFALRSSDTYNLGTTQLTRFTKEIVKMDDPTVVYWLLDPEDGYNEMAEICRDEFLKDREVTEAENAPFYLQLTGATMHNTTIAGIPVTTSRRLTGYADAKKLLEEISQSVKGQIVLKYIADQKTVSGEYPTAFSWDGALGSSAERNEFLEYCKEKDILCVPGINLLSYRNQTLETLTWFHAVSTLVGDSALLCAFDLSNRQVDYTVKPSYLVKMSSAKQFIEGLIDSLKKESVSGVAPETLGKYLYTDFSDGEMVSRDETAKEIAKLAEKMSGSFSELLLSDANAYLLPYATRLDDVPSESSGYMLTDLSIPFYQLVLNGKIEYATSAINMSASENRTFLMALESGSALKYSMITESIDALKGTDLEDSYYLSSEGWKERCMERYEMFNEVYRATEGFDIRTHEILTKNTRKVTYQNGAVVYVNYSDGDYTTEDGVVVPAHGYLLKK